MCNNYEPKVWELCLCVQVYVCVCVIALSYASPGLLGYLDVEYRYHYYAKSD